MVIGFREGQRAALLKYVKSLIDLQDETGKEFQILISSGDYTDEIVVEVNEIFRDSSGHSMSSEYKLVDEDQVIMKEYEFPDKHYEYFQSDDDYEASLEAWLEAEKEAGQNWTRVESPYRMPYWTCESTLKEN